MLEIGYIAKYKDLKDVLERSASSAERDIKKQLNVVFLKKLIGKNENKRNIEKNYIVVVNETGRGGRYVVERSPSPELESTDF